MTTLDFPALLTRQADLQLLGNMPTPTPTQLRIAYLTEVGELAQEMKHAWAWWKKPGDRPVRSERILSELADVLHFWLLIALREGWRMEGKRLEDNQQPDKAKAVHLVQEELDALNYSAWMGWTAKAERHAREAEITAAVFGLTLEEIMEGGKQ